MPAINVFVSYADSFVGKRVLSQFQQFPSTYHVYGCTWDSAAAEKLNAAAAARNAAAVAAADAVEAANARHGSGGNGGATTATAGAGAAAAEMLDDAAQSLLHNSRGTLTPCETSRADTAPLPEDYTHGSAYNNSNSSTNNANGNGAVNAAGGLAEQFPAGATPTAAAAPGAATKAAASSAFFFSRHDVAATRAALLACDWIVLELRQAQTVLEVVHFLQLQTSFVRPKRLVLLSSLMTWYATPALTAGGDGIQGGNDNNNNEEEGDDDEAAAAGGDGEAGEVDAPYPPAPPQLLERIVHAAQDAARRAVVDAMRGGRSGSGGGNGNDVDDGDFDGLGGGEDGSAEGVSAPAAAGGGGDGSAAAVEVLTEDQFNRRVPHLHYLSWRDAEKAVAAAHHARGLPLDTFVVCSGLPYGGEEEALEPLFRLAWSAQPEKETDGAAGAGVDVSTGTFTPSEAPAETGTGAATDAHAVPALNTPTNAAAAAAAAVPAATAVLPIFGDGTQAVPLVHAQDLACFVRKLLRCPAASLPFPERRYLFVTDGSNSNTWSSIVGGVNRMFGGRCALQPVPPSAYPLYRDVDKFTLNVRVEAESMKALMERQDDAEEETASGVAGAMGDNDAATAARLPNTWVAEGGLHRHLRAVAHEFAAARGVQPLRIALVGPPLVGKSYLAAKLARHYRLPCISMDGVVAEYTAALRALRERMAAAKAAVTEAERKRRLAIKRRRVVLRQQQEWDAAVEAADGAGGSGGGARAAHDELDEALDDASSNTEGGGQHPQSQPHPSSPAATQQMREVAASAFELTPAEEDDITRFVQDWWQEQPQVQAWASKAGEMERVLLLRLHPRPPTPDANPKKRAAGGGGGGGGGTKKKGNASKDAQKSKEDEEELRQLKASLQHAPFQARALTLMLRWRLAQPDCRVQGFVLDGVPATLELARMIFNADTGESGVQPPATEEEALKPRYAGEGGYTGGTGGGAEGDGRGANSANGGGEGGAAGPASAKEVASDARLPDHVLVLQASDTFLLSRLRAMGVAAERHLSSNGTKASAVDGTSAVDVETFQQDLQTYKREYEEATYSVLSYWECAAAVVSPTSADGSHGRNAPRERRAEVHLVTVEGHEPLVPAPPPASAFAEEPVGDTEQLLRQVIVGPPHNFGQSLEEVQREAVRQRCLAEEESRAQAAAVAAQAAAESAECAEEQSTRASEDERLAELKRADLAELEARKQPMTRYLQERVLPLLHKGLLEVCATRPEDPVDFLAEWLIRHNPHDDTFCDI